MTTALLLDCILALAVAAQVPQSGKIVAFDGEEDSNTGGPEESVHASTTASTAAMPLRRGRLIPPPPPVTGPNWRTSPGVRASLSVLGVTSPYGIRTDPFTGHSRMHTGIDIKAAHGESVGASMDGVVTYAGVRGAYGNLVVVDHGDGVSTWYAHLSAVAVSAGQAVTAGQLLGFVGSTGRSTGPHLHFEARANGYPFNPMHRVSFERGALHIEGMRVRDAEPQIHEALPAAPGGTVIRVDWSGDVMKSDGGTMAVEWD